MKKFLSRIIFLTLSTCILVSMSSFAAPQKKKDSLSEVTYDLTSNKEQSFILIDSSNDYVYVKITPLLSSVRIANGEYKVSYTKPKHWTGSFIVSISNNRISAARTPSVKAISGSIANYSLRKKSSTEAILSLGWQPAIPLYQINSGFKAYISSGNLKVSEL